MHKFNKLKNDQQKQQRKRSSSAHTLNRLKRKKTLKAAYIREAWIHITYLHQTHKAKNNTLYIRNNISKEKAERHFKTQRKEPSAESLMPGENIFPK